MALSVISNKSYRKTESFLPQDVLKTESFVPNVEDVACKRKREGVSCAMEPKWLCRKKVCSNVKLLHA